MMRRASSVLLFIIIACCSNDGVAVSHLEELFQSEAGQAAESNAPALWARAQAARERAVRATRAEHTEAAADHRTAARLWLSAAIVRSEALRARAANAERLAEAEAAENRILAVEREAERFENQIRQGRANRYGETTAANAHERASRDEARRSRQSEEANNERDDALASRVRHLLEMAQALSPDNELPQVVAALRLARRSRRPSNLRETLDDAYWMTLAAYSASIRSRDLPSCREWIDTLSVEPNSLTRTATGLHYTTSQPLDSNDSEVWSNLVQSAPRPALIFVNLSGQSSIRAQRLQRLRDAASTAAGDAIEVLPSFETSAQPSLQLPCL